VVVVADDHGDWIWKKMRGEKNFRFGKRKKTCFVLDRVR